MTDRLYECPVLGCSYLNKGISGLSEHINEEHPGGFNDPKQPSFSSPRQSSTRCPATTTNHEQSTLPVYY